MGVKICVEGVETKDELMAVTKLEADIYRGIITANLSKTLNFAE